MRNGGRKKGKRLSGWRLQVKLEEIADALFHGAGVVALDDNDENAVLPMAADLIFAGQRDIIAEEFDDGGLHLRGKEAGEGDIVLIDVDEKAAARGFAFDEPDDECDEGESGEEEEEVLEPGELVEEGLREIVRGGKACQECGRKAQKFTYKRPDAACQSSILTKG